ncbi:DUF6415 family natural product biosynthesis protein [Streptomyces telluris]|uniref:DUF6415 family natural product biosynthesis protein n=1 Tax=Streptomyces telluris TaxID=2720021 RepID=A0A9X2LDV9_9ACTN|nr:DUF6415 family natural product biosynthesis protein [Streptomyces telluris]MCQ8769147.1 DUF6415 family natural product biosynthesis protein [Streptomyces telluris]NJP80715.1 hypothetical protein [Streptomyces telluris]
MPPFPHTARTGGGVTLTPSEPSPVSIGQALREATAMETWLPAPSRLGEVTERLLGYIRETGPAVEAAASRRPAECPVRRSAFAAVEEARHRSGVGPGNGYASAITFARGLGKAAGDLMHQQRRLQREGER